MEGNNPYAPPVDISPPKKYKTAKIKPTSPQKELHFDPVHSAIPLVLFALRKKHGDHTENACYFDDINTNLETPAIFLDHSNLDNIPTNTPLHTLLHEYRGSAIQYNAVNAAGNNDKYEITHVDLNYFKPPEAKAQHVEDIDKARETITEHGKAILRILNNQKDHQKSFELSLTTMAGMLHGAKRALTEPDTLSNYISNHYKNWGLITQAYNPANLYDLINRPTLNHSLKTLHEEGLGRQQIVEIESHLQAMKDTLANYRDSIDIGVHHLLYQQAKAGMSIHSIKKEEERPGFLQQILHSEKLEVTHGDVTKAKSHMPFP